MSAPASVVDEEREFAAFETRWASECEREFAVRASCDCRLFGVLLAVLAAVAGGLASEFSRRRMPPTAYETGYVKKDEARCGVWGGGEDCGVSAAEDIAWAGRLELQ